MSAFPQIVWRPSPKDVVAEFAPRTFFHRITNAAAAPVVTTNTGKFVPIDQVLLLHHLLAVFDPGAAQVLQNATVSVLEETGVQQQAQLIGGPGAGNAPIVAGGVTALSWSGEIVLTNTEILNVAGSFDLGAASNAVALHIAGYMVPRGNWQR